MVQIGRNVEIRVTFVGGPMNTVTALTDGLNELKVFFPQGEKRVIAYRRDPLISELAYIWDRKLSEDMSRDFDQVKAFFNDNEPASLRVEDNQVHRAEIGGFSEDQITPLEDEDENSAD